MSDRVCNRDCFNCPYDDCIFDGDDAVSVYLSRKLDRELYRATHPPMEFSEQRRASRKRANRAYRERHRDEMNAVHRDWYWRNHAYALGYQREYYRTHKGKAREAREEARKAREEVREEAREEVRKACEEARKAREEEKFRRRRERNQATLQRWIAKNQEESKRKEVESRKAREEARKIFFEEF